MTDVEQLHQRIGEVERHVLTSTDSQQAMVDRIQEGLNAIQAGFVRKQVEIEEHKDEITRLRYENGRLRTVVDRLLQSVEQSCAGDLKGVLSDLEARVGGLVELAEAEVTTAEQAVAAPAAEAGAGEGPPSLEPRGSAEGPAAAPDPEPDRQTASKSDEKAKVSGGKSAWLAEVMRRAAALSTEITDSEERASGGPVGGTVSVRRNVEAYGPEPGPLSLGRAAREDKPLPAADGRAA